MAMAFHRYPPCRTPTQYNQEQSWIEAWVNSGSAPANFQYPYNYLIKMNGVDCEAYSSVGLLTYGGATDVGGVDGADFSHVANAAITATGAAGGGTVLFKKADYTAIDPLSLTSYWKISLLAERGTTITADAAFTGHAIIDKEDEWADPSSAGRIMVDSFNLDCNSVAGVYGIHFHRASNTQITNNEVYGSADYGVAVCGHNMQVAHNYIHDCDVGLYYDTGYNGVIEQNYFRDCTTNGAFIDQNTAGKIKDNLMYNCGTAIYDNLGIWNEYSGNHILIGATGIKLVDSQYTLIEKNRIDNLTGYGIAVLSDTVPVYGTRIHEDNIINNIADTGILLWPKNSQPIYNTSIKDNTLLSCTNYGIYYLSGGGVLDFVKTQDNIYGSCGANTDFTLATNVRQEDWDYTPASGNIAVVKVGGGTRTLEFNKGEYMSYADS